MDSIINRIKILGMGFGAPLIAAVILTAIYGNAITINGDSSYGISFLYYFVSFFVLEATLVVFGVLCFMIYKGE